MFETAFRNKQNKILTKKKKNNDVETHCANVQLVTRSFFPSRRCAYSEFNRRCCACITWKRIINSRANWHEKSLSERGDRDLWTMNNNRPILFLLFLYSIEQKKQFHSFPNSCSPFSTWKICFPTQTSYLFILRKINSAIRKMLSHRTRISVLFFFPLA